MSKFNEEGVWKGKDLSMQQLFVDEESGRNDLYVLGYGDMEVTDVVDFDNPDTSLLNDIIMKDFAHKLWMLFYENINFPRVYGKAIYDVYFDKYARQMVYYGYKKRVVIKHKKLDWELEWMEKYISDYFNEQLKYLPQFKMAEVTPDLIGHLFGGGESPIVFFDLVKVGLEGDIRLFYSITR